MDLSGWTPVRVLWREGEPRVEWRWTGDARFTEPFFEQTIERCLLRPFSLLFPHETAPAALRDPDGAPALEPDGFIFHLSRCGSTLVSQMLAAVPEHIVVSEAAAVDGILTARLAGVSDEQRAEWLRWVVGSLGRARHGERRYFVKLDSWHTLELPFIASVFPDVPWIFVYRDPVEVLASHLQFAGPQVIPGALPPELLGLEYSSLSEITLEEYAARYLARVAGAALDAVDVGRGRLVEYRTLPAAVVDEIASHFALDLGRRERELMAAAAGRDAKNPALEFEADGERKRREITDVGREAAERLVQPVYERLEAARLERGATAC